MMQLKFTKRNHRQQDLRFAWRPRHCFFFPAQALANDNKYGNDGQRLTQTSALVACTATLGIAIYAFRIQC